MNEKKMKKINKQVIEEFQEIINEYIQEEFFEISQFIKIQKELQETCQDVFIEYNDPRCFVGDSPQSVFTSL